MSDFKTTAIEENVITEYINAPYFITNDDVGVVCDDCYKDFLKWHDKLTEEEHIQIRKQQIIQ